LLSVRLLFSSLLAFCLPGRPLTEDELKNESVKKQVDEFNAKQASAQQREADSVRHRGFFSVLLDKWAQTNSIKTVTKSDH
jgi:hypothetical protein